MPVSENKFGITKDGKEVKIYTITNSKGAMASFINYGGSIVNIIVPDKDGILRDVNLGYDDFSGYEDGIYYFGEIIGRNGNRIAGGKFSINGKEYQLELNERGVNNLHSGSNKYSNRMWEAKVVGEKVVFSLHSPDNDQGFPGAFDIKVTYEFTDNCVLRINYEGRSDADTVANMTNHSFFNLNGEGEGDPMNHTLQIYADYITEVDENSIPTGKMYDVTGTPFDFRNPKPISRDVNLLDPQMKIGNGYDHNFVINGEGLRDVAILTSVDTGIQMKVRTDLPGMQFYAGNALGKNGNNIGKSGHIYEEHSGLALETQFHPNAINIPEFKSPILKANSTYRTTTEYIFSIAI